MVSNNVAAEAGTHAPTDPQWVVFVCGGRHWGFPLDVVREILTPRPFTRLPGAGPEVCGLIGVRGRVVTVLDLGVLLADRAAASLPDHRLLLLELGARRVGAAVDEVVTIGAAALKPGEDASGVELGAGEVDAQRFTALDPIALTAALLV
jgi:purine-binding chemotaxis protein CheW